MCARYELDDQPTNIAARFGLIEPPALMNMSTVRPTDQALVLNMAGEAVLCGWGFEVTWDKKPLINGRSESLQEKPTFRPLLENRCLVPATAYYEWRATGSSKLKNTVRPSDQPLFSMAGLMDGDRFVILTCPPCPEITHIHNRMPVILSCEAEKSWLDPALKFEAVAQSLTPYSQAPVMAQEDRPPPPRQRDLFH